MYTSGVKNEDMLIKARIFKDRQATPPTRKVAMQLISFFVHLSTSLDYTFWVSEYWQQKI